MKPEGKKGAKAGGAATAEAKPGRAERIARRNAPRDDSAPAPDAEPDAPQENEAETEDTE